MRKTSIRLFFALSCIEGLAALAWLLKDRSEARNALLLGYSANRLALIAAVLGLLALLAAAAFWLLKRARAGISPGVPARLEPYLPGAAALLFLAALAGAGFLAATWRLPSPGLDAFLAQFSSGLPRRVESLRPVIERSRPVGLWLVLLTAQVALALGSLRPFSRAVKDGTLPRALLAVLLAAAAAAHWAVLFFQLKTLLVIPGWKWYFHAEPLAPGWPLIFTAVFLAALAAAGWAASGRARRPAALAALILAGAALQIGFGYMRGAGFESLRVKYADSVFNNYAEAAAAEPGWIAPLRNYEQLYGGDWYLGTKPPGVLLTYITAQKLSNLVNPVNDTPARFVRLTQFLAYTLPFLSFLVLIPLYRLGRSLADEAGGLFAASLYITCPNVLLIPLFLDQALYPLLFMLILLLTWRMIARQSLPAAVLAGLSVYTALYFSFSLLPLLTLPLLWLALQTWLQRKERSFKRAALLAAAFAGGVLLGLLLFRLLLNYDILTRYTNAMIQHQRAKEFQPGWGQVIEALLLNNAEMATWTGLPLTLLFAAFALLSLLRWVRGQAGRLDGLFLAFAGAYAALNLVGQTRGEVQRLWLFLVPLVCLFAAQEARRLFRRPAPGLLLTAALQLITTLLIFLFQDFYG